MSGRATITMTVSLATYDRLAELLRHGDADVVLNRLLDRDPHDHEHRCPTCARRALLYAVATPDDQEVLFSA